MNKPVFKAVYHLHPLSAQSTPPMVPFSQVPAPNHQLLPVAHHHQAGNLPGVTWWPCALHIKFQHLHLGPLNTILGLGWYYCRWVVVGGCFV